ncbi:unnamed protein product, partial [Nippostrongylus brasiliensis]|uniref:BL1S4 n=1 Tax=Nippostrongylus brasiliensis TaxID=27835 RepID=A0A0N4YL95_NIPBR
MPKAKDPPAAPSAVPAKRMRPTPPSLPCQPSNTSEPTSAMGHPVTSETTPSTTPTAGPPQLKADKPISGRDDMVTAYKKTYQTGAALIEAVCNENMALKKEIKELRRTQAPDMSALVSEMKDFYRESCPDFSDIEKKLDDLKTTVDHDNDVRLQHLQNWKTDVMDRIDKLLQMKTPCALTKVDM